MTSGPGTKSFIEMLSDIASRAQMFTTASGAAIAITDADNNMVTLASAGQAAPPPGTQLRLDGSFTGIAVQTAREIICEDSETDGRADAATYVAIGIRSLAMVPIVESTAVRGVLAVFSDVPNAFSRKDAAVLKTMADVVLSALQTEARSGEMLGDEPEESAPELKPPAVVNAITAAKPASIVPTASINAASADPVGKPSQEISARSEVVPVAESIAPPKKMREPEPVTTRTTKKPDEPQVRNNVVPISTATAPALARRPEARVERSPELNPGDLLGLLREAAQPTEASSTGSSNKKLMMIATAVVAIVLMAAVGYSVFRRSSVRRQPAAAQAPVTQQQAPEQSQLRAVEIPLQQPVAMPNVQTQAKKKPSTPTGENALVEQEYDNASVTVLQPSPSKRPVTNADEDTVEPPSLALSGGNMPALGGVPTSTPQLARHVPVAIQPVPLEQPKPAYPEIARHMGLTQGSVVMNVRVNKDGSVGEIKVVRGERILQPAAVTAVKRWRYKPATTDGQPMAYNVQVEMRFSAK
jgi:TonB family protein